MTCKYCLQNFDFAANSSPSSMEEIIEKEYFFDPQKDIDLQTALRSVRKSQNFQPLREWFHKMGFLAGQAFFQNPLVKTELHYRSYREEILWASVLGQTGKNFFQAAFFQFLATTEEKDFSEGFCSYFIDFTVPTQEREAFLLAAIKKAKDPLRKQYLANLLFRRQRTAFAENDPPAAEETENFRKAFLGIDQESYNQILLGNWQFVYYKAINQEMGKIIAQRLNLESVRTMLSSEKLKNAYYNPRDLLFFALPFVDSETFTQIENEIKTFVQGGGNAAPSRHNDALIQLLKIAAYLKNPEENKISVEQIKHFLDENFTVSNPGKADFMIEMLPPQMKRKILSSELQDPTFYTDGFGKKILENLSGEMFVDYPETEALCRAITRVVDKSGSFRNNPVYARVLFADYFFQQKDLVTGEKFLQEACERINCSTYSGGSQLMNLYAKKITLPPEANSIIAKNYRKEIADNKISSRLSNYNYLAFANKTDCVDLIQEIWQNEDKKKLDKTFALAENSNNPYFFDFYFQEVAPHFMKNKFLKNDFYNSHLRLGYLNRYTTAQKEQMRNFLLKSEKPKITSSEELLELIFSLGNDPRTKAIAQKIIKTPQEKGTHSESIKNKIILANEYLAMYKSGNTTEYFTQPLKNWR